MGSGRDLTVEGITYTHRRLAQADVEIGGITPDASAALLSRMLRRVREDGWVLHGEVTVTVRDNHVTAGWVVLTLDGYVQPAYLGPAVRP